MCPIKIRQRMKEGWFLERKLGHCHKNTDRQSPQMPTMLDYTRGEFWAWTLERDLCETELRAWSEDPLGCGPSPLGPCPSRICLWPLPQHLGLTSALPQPQWFSLLVWVTSKQSQVIMQVRSRTGWQVQSEPGRRLVIVGVSSQLHQGLSR